MSDALLKVTEPLNSRAGMRLHWRTPGFHDAPEQTQRVIGDHVYIAQRYPGRIDMWRLDLPDETRGARWTLVHRMGGAA